MRLLQTSLRFILVNYLSTFTVSADNIIFIISKSQELPCRAYRFKNIMCFNLNHKIDGLGILMILGLVVEVANGMTVISLRTLLSKMVSAEEQGL